MSEKIYFDCAATTPLDPETFAEMTPYFTEVFGNGNSQHAFGRQAEIAISNARRKVAAVLGAEPGEIYFTSGGTESNNWAIRGIAEAHGAKGNHIITSAIEHHAADSVLKYLETKGFEVTYLPVDKEGFINLDDLKKAIKPTTILITIMFANNEVGTIEPVAEIGKIARENKIYFHTDAVQATGALPIDVKAMNIDLLSLSAHKFYGPKGVGVLYKRNGVKLQKFMIGGEQERGARGGTHNTPGIVGLAFALEKAANNMQKTAEYVGGLRDYFVSEVTKKIPYATYNGPKNPAKRLPNNAHFTFDFIEGEAILLRLDLEGIAVSSGSACSSGSLDPSHVVLALGIPIERAHGSIRFSFGKYNTREEIDYTVEKLTKVIADLRKMSPLFKQFDGEQHEV